MKTIIPIVVGVATALGMVAAPSDAEARTCRHPAPAEGFPGIAKLRAYNTTCAIAVDIADEIRREVQNNNRLPARVLGDDYPAYEGMTFRCRYRFVKTGLGGYMSARCVHRKKRVTMNLSS